MPRMQVYLPDELYDEVKQRGISPSELLQQAVRAELRRTALQEETDRYVAELVEEVGGPSAAAAAKAESVARRLAAHRPDTATG